MPRVRLCSFVSAVVPLSLLLIGACGKKASEKDGGTGTIVGSAGAGVVGSGGSSAGTAGSGASVGSGGSAGNGATAGQDGSAPPDGPTCGLAGLPCCANGTCTDPSVACDRSYVCAPCGGPGQVCCDGQPSCVAPNTCAVGARYTCGCTSTTNTACAGCGTPGHRCCSTSPQCSSDSVCGSDGVNDVCFACGGPGQACCPGSTCAAGGCCFNNSCVADGHACRLPTSGFGICSGGVCACGKVGQRCCPKLSTDPPGGGSTCSQANTVCRGSEPSDMCYHCGELGETCCPPIGSTPCNGTTVCDQPSSTCKPCGVTGNPCCAGNKCNDTGACCSMDGNSGSGGRCVANGSLCSQQNTGSPGVCMSGSCRCGSRNQPCCQNPPTPPCGNPQDRCGEGGCVPCGVAGNPCCANNTCENGGCCAFTKCIASGATCTAPGGMAFGACSATGACGSCGGLSQPCCELPGLLYICTAPNTFCSFQAPGQGTCQACGGAGQPCCPTDPSANIGVTCLTGLTCQPVSTGNNTCQP